MNLIQRIQTALLEHGAEAVYGAVDWKSVAGDIKTFLEAREGWRSATASEQQDHGARLVEYDENDRPKHVWVRADGVNS